MTMRCHLPPVKMVVFKKTTNNKPWQRCGKGNLVHRWWGCELMHLLWNRGLRNSTSEYLSKENENTNLI